MKDGCALYDVPLVGGHLTVNDGPPSLSAFGVGSADAVLSATHVAVGQSLVVACCTSGTMRADFPFFRSFDERGDRLAGDVRVLADLARSGACVAAKDVSMAGLVGSLAMLLEWSRLGVTLDLDVLPRPPACPWPTGSPASRRTASCCARRRVGGRVPRRVSRPRARRGGGGQIDDSGVLALRSGAGRRRFSTSPPPG